MDFFWKCGHFKCFNKMGSHLNEYFLLLWLSCILFYGERLAALMTISLKRCFLWTRVFVCDGVIVCLSQHSSVLFFLWRHEILSCMCCRWWMLEDIFREKYFSWCCAHFYLILILPNNRSRLVLVGLKAALLCLQCERHEAFRQLWLWRSGDSL